VFADLTAKYPKFSGTGYIAFPVLRGAHREFHLIVELRPDVLNGLVLFSAAHPDAQSDFFSLSLQRGRIELRCVRCQHHHYHHHHSTPRTIRTGVNYNVRVRLDKKNMS